MSQNEEQHLQTEMNHANELPPLPEDQAEVLDNLQASLTKEDKLLADIKMVFQEHLRKSITPDTYGRIWRGLAMYLDEDSVSYLIYILRMSDDDSYIGQIMAHCTDQFWHGFRQLIALFADDLRRAYRVYNENPNAWDEITNRRTYFDYLTNSWNISFEIVKYDGDRFAIEETPSGGLALIRSLLYMLMMVPEENAPDLIDKDYLAETYTQFTNLVQLYAPELLSEETGKVEKSA